MQQEQKILSESFTSANFGAVDDVRLPERMEINSKQRRNKTYSSDKSNIRVYSSATDDRQPTQLAEIRHAVQYLTIVYTLLLTLIIIIAELLLGL